MSAKELCKKEKGINKLACMRFFNASTGEEGTAALKATFERQQARKKKAKKTKAQTALGIK